MMALLFGPPGVGKGTQADMLSRQYGFTNLSTGDLLRNEASQDTSLGKKITHYLNQGLLVPDEIICDVVEKYVSARTDQHILFDGFPRTLTQAKNLDTILQEFGRSLQVALELHLSEEEVVSRLINRRYCPQCGRIYNLLTNPPRKKNTCDGCQTELTKRTDDNEEVIRKRLHIYDQETRPLVKYYQESGIYHKIDAHGFKEEIFKKISKIIDAHINKE